ncbi:hypothetical protein L2E82_44277 [Cichorium intybus]|uniref:Uncharacterized protein n=1 Tax=Cichorium intybus TaxID=13427 RepID=A0ACB8ZP65_CICIN|nr:hypothetical protein L2E82_44277 [Cichorium intybus]
MAQAGILFLPVNGGISEISFDSITSTLYLPVVDLDVNSEVYLRNLVAYEACVATGPLVVARYTELMNGIIDTEEDAKYLRERGIVLNHLKSDKEVADLWNGMSKSVKLTKVAKMDKVWYPCSEFNSILAGATCNNGRVYKLSLQNLGLRGPISPYISNCTNLQSLDLSNNSLAGPIPVELQYLVNLAVLNLSSNHLSDAIPPSLAICF